MPFLWQHLNHPVEASRGLPVLLAAWTNELKCFESSVLSISHGQHLVHWKTYHLWHPVICFSRWKTHHIGLYLSGNAAVLP